MAQNNNDVVIRFLMEADTSGAKKAASATDEVTKKAKESGTAIGMSRREWMRTGSEAAFYARTATGGLGEVNKGLTQSIGLATQLGESALFGGAFGVALATGAYLIGQMVAQEQALAKPAQDVEAALSKQEVASSDLGKAIQGVTNLSAKEADAWAKAAQSSNVIASAIRDQAKAHEELARAQARQPQTGFQAAEQQYSDLITKNLNGEADAARWAGLGLQYLQAQTQKQVDTQQEQNRVLGILNNNLPKIEAATRSYGREVKDLNDAYARTSAKSASDLLKVDIRAAKDRLKIEADTTDAIIELRNRETERIQSIQSDLATRLGDMRHDHLNDEKEQYYQYTKSIRELNYDLAEQTKDNAKDRLRIEKDVNDDIERIYKDALKDEKEAHTYSEVLKIREEAADRRDEATKKAAEQRDEIADREQEQQREFDHRRTLANEEYLHSKGLRDRDLEESISRAQRDADNQINETRRQTEQQIAAAREREIEQKKALQERVEAEKQAIRERAVEEEASYLRARARARENYVETIAQLTDTQTEQQKLESSWLFIRDNTDLATDSVFRYRAALMGLPPAYNDSWSTFKKPAGWYQTEPGQYRVVPGPANQAVPAIVHGGEVIGRPGGGGGVTVKVYVDGHELRGIAREVIAQDDLT